MTLHQRREFFGYTYIPGRSGRSRCSARPVRRRCWLTRRRRRRWWRNTACRGGGGGCGSAWAGGWRRTCVGKAVSQERLTTEAQRHRDTETQRHRERRWCVLHGALWADDSTKCPKLLLLCVALCLCGGDPCLRRRERPLPRLGRIGWEAPIGAIVQEHNPRERSGGRVGMARVRADGGGGRARNVDFAQ